MVERDHAHGLFRSAIVDAVGGHGFVEASVDPPLWVRGDTAVRVEVASSGRRVRVDVLIGAGEAATRHPVQQWFDDALRLDARDPPRLGAPPVPAELDPCRIGIPIETQEQLQKWVDRVRGRLRAWVDASQALHDAIGRAIEGVGTELAGARSVQVQPATAFVGRYQRVGEVAELRGRLQFSPGGRWLAVNEPGLVHVIDPAACEERATIPLPTQGATRYAIGPNGTSIALRTADTLEVRRDSGVAVAVDRPPPPPFGVDLVWDSSGMLWLTDVDDGGNHVLCVRSPELEVIDTIPVPGPHNQVRWSEPTFALHPPSGTVVLLHVAGDTFISLTFHRVVDGKIITAPVSADSEDPGFDANALSELCVSEDGKEIVGLDGYTRLVTWTLPSCRAVAHGVEDPPPEGLRLGVINHIGGAIAAPLEEDSGWVRHVWCFDPTDHRASGSTIITPPLRFVDAAGPWLAGVNGPAVQLLRMVGAVVDVARVRAGPEARTERIFARAGETILDVTRKALWSRARNS